MAKRRVNKCDCGAEIPKEAHMCDDCYMAMKGITPGPQFPEEAS